MSEQQTPDQLGKFLFVAEHPGAGHRVTVEIRGDSTISDVADALESFLVAAGFDRGQVMEIFK